MLLKNSIDFTSVMLKVFCINWTAHIIQRKIVSLEIFIYPGENQQIFKNEPDQNVSVAGYKHIQCQFFGINIGSQFILVFLQ